MAAATTTPKVFKFVRKCGKEGTRMSLLVVFSMDKFPEDYVPDNNDAVVDLNHENDSTDSAKWPYDTVIARIVSTERL